MPPRTRSFVRFGESRKPKSLAVLDERITVCMADPSSPEPVPARGGTAAERAARRSRSGNPAYRQHRGAGSRCQAHRRFDGRNRQARTNCRGLSNAWRGAVTKASAKPVWPVDGRLRKRDVAQPSNTATVAYEGEWWKLNLVVRDFLRVNADVARNYASAKWHAVSNGADTLLAYSERSAPSSK